MKKQIKQIIILVCLVIVLILPYFVFAQNPALERMQDVASGPEGAYQADTDETTVSKIVGTAVKALFGLLGVIFIGLMLYGGFNWMTASGDESKYSRAKDTIRRAIIGLIITVGSFAIWNYILVRFLASN